MSCPHCGKVCHGTKSDAYAALRQTNGQRLQIYRCYSGYWHLGTVDAWNGKRRKQGAW